MLPSIHFLLSLFLAHPIGAQSTLSTSSSYEMSTSISTASVRVESITGPRTIVYDYGSSLKTSVIGATVTDRIPSNTTGYLSFPSAETTSTSSFIGITGGNSTAVFSGTVSSTSRSLPTNSQRCNGYVEFCDRKFSNISMVVAHNSPFVVPHNAASNQVYPVRTQLNNGIRGRRSLSPFSYPDAKLS